MQSAKMKFRQIRLAGVAALALAGLSLTGCVVYPSGYAYNTYGSGYAPSYYAPPPVYGSVIIGGGGGWGGGGWGGGDRDGGDWHGGGWHGGGWRH